MPDAVLEVRSATVDYGSDLALDSASISLHAGEIHALVGENGAGKSTLIGVMSGAVRPAGGEIVLGGEPVRFATPRHAIDAGVVTVRQELDLLTNLTVAENIWLGREPRRFGRIDWTRMRAGARTILEDLGMDIDPDLVLGSLPIALQQFVAIARAVSSDVRVLVLDEPTSSLDVDEVAALFGVVRQLADRGAAVLFVSHFLDQVYELCDRITVLRGGRVVGEYPTRAVLRVDLIRTMVGPTSPPLQFEAIPPPAPDDPHDAALRATDLAAPPGLRHADVTLRRGEVLGLAGLLGSGRTELARVLTGVDRADAGTVRAGDRRIEGLRDALRAGVVYLSENRRTDGIIAELSIQDNITLALQADRGILRRLGRARRRELAASWIEALRIRPADPDRPVAELSGGNQQKVLLARLLALAPRVLVLDEPTRGIDVGARLDVQNVVAELAAHGLSVVYISAELDEVLRVSDRVAVLREGRIVEVVPADALDADRLLALVARPADRDA